MDGVMLRFYVDESQRHRGVMLWEWLLAAARALNVPGGTAFHSVGSFGRHGVLHEAAFFELAGETAVAVEFIVNADLAERLLERVREEGVRTVWAKIPLAYGVTGGESSDSV